MQINTTPNQHGSFDYHVGCAFEVIEAAEDAKAWWVNANEDALEALIVACIHYGMDTKAEISSWVEEQSDPYVAVTVETLIDERIDFHPNCCWTVKPNGKLKLHARNMALRKVTIL